MSNNNEAQKNGDRAAFPKNGERGLDKREYVAALAMQGLLANTSSHEDFALYVHAGIERVLPLRMVARAAVRYADALLRALEDIES